MPVGATGHQDGAGALICDCANGTVYATLNSLKQHQRYYCSRRREGNLVVPRNAKQGPASTSGNFDCPLCGKPFSKFQGMRLHISKIHPIQYNQENIEIAEKAAGKRWSRNEIGDMARMEAPYLGYDINQYLATKLPHRTLESIKAQRRRADYKQLVEQIRGDIEEATEDDDHTETSSDDDVFSVHDTSDSANTPTEQPSSGEEETNAPIEPSSPIGVEITYNPTPPNGPPSQPASPIDTPPTPPAPNSSNQHRNIPQFVNELTVLVRNHLSGDHLTESLLEKVAGEHATLADVKEYLHSLTGSVRSAVNTKSRRPEKGRNPKRRDGRNANRAYKFKVTQELFKRDPALLANNIFNCIEPNRQEECPPIERIEEEYGTIFGASSKDDDEGITDMRQHQVDCCSFITTEEVERFRRQRGSGTPGPDRIRLADVRSMSLYRLTFIYNVIFTTGLIPTSLKRCRTTLIPKGGDTLNVNNWRPITISSVFLRIFHKILAARLSKLPIDFKQRGFRNIDGTLANSLILQSLIKDCRRKNTPHTIITIDLRKAFDCVSHNSIRRSLRRFAVGDRMAGYLEQAYTGFNTRITCGGQVTGEIPISRGVRQGDPMSPVLFNLVMDELLCLFNEHNIGLRLGEHRVPALAYADDLVLLAETPYEAQKLLRLCQCFLAKRGMSINSAKCTSLTAFRVPHKKKLAIQSTSKYVIDGSLIPAITVAQSYKYLGAHYNFRGAITEETNITALLNRLSAAPLKPQQKLHIARTYLLPKYIHGLQNPTISLKKLEGVDAAVRFFVKRTLHLPVTTPNACLYATCRAGGLGIFGFRDRIPIIMRERMCSLRNSRDEHVSAALWTEYSGKLLLKLERWGLRRGTTTTSVKNHWTAVLEASSSGNGITEGKATRHSGNWICEPPQYWSGAEYVGALQLRTNTLPCLGGLQNAQQPLEAKKCRAGCGRVETVSHILQKCPAVHNARLQRHNHVVSLLARMASKKGWTVEEEPRIRDTNGLLRKPDLVLTRETSTILCEATVSWEGPDGLSAARQNKVATYGYPAFVEAMRSRYPGKTLAMLPLIIGARGIWPPDNQALADTIGLTGSDIKQLVTATIKGGILIHRRFMRGV